MFVLSTSIPRFKFLHVCSTFSYSRFNILNACSKCIRNVYLIVLNDLKNLIVKCLHMKTT